MEEDFKQSQLKAVAKAIALLAALNLKTVLDNQYFYAITGVAAKVRGAVIHAIFDKLLTINQKERDIISVVCSN